jgi:hydroxymethylpyrimidine pyrophosphatase-like HAD family hydrolase
LHLEGANLITGELNDTLRENPNGAIVISKEGSEEILKSYIDNKYQGKIMIRFWGSNKFAIAELYSPSTSKGAALEKLAQDLNIPKEKIIAIGDGHNDIEMVSFAEYGVAMANSHPDLRKVASDNTLSVEENGVYQYLSKFFN